jgi:hypothetical protein
MALVYGIEPKDLAETGWGVIFHERESPTIREALRTLLERRRGQAGDLYKEYSNSSGFHDGESKEHFLMNRGAGLGPSNPHRMPYYLLIVGEPKLIPFQFQHELDVQYAVGRICFDTPEEYERYARSVIQVEDGRSAHKRQMTLFGVQNRDDLPTKLSTDYLVQPLAERLTVSAGWQKTQGWIVRRLLAEEAKKERLHRLLGGEETPALLVTASHGMSFPCGHPLQRAHQGALLCQDWPGPNDWQQSVPPDYYFSADDIGPDAELQGLIAFHLASHSIGTSVFEESAQPNVGQREVIAPDPFRPSGESLVVLLLFSRFNNHRGLREYAPSPDGGLSSGICHGSL